MYMSSNSDKRNTNRPSKGQGGVPKICAHPKYYCFCELKPHVKFQNYTITPSGRKVSEAEREKREREKSAIYSGHLLL